MRPRAVRSRKKASQPAPSSALVTCRPRIFRCPSALREAGDAALARDVVRLAAEVAEWVSSDHGLAGQDLFEAAAEADTLRMADIADRLCTRA